VLVCLSGSALAQGTTSSWDFAVLLDDQPIGSHRFDLMADGTTAVLESVASFDVKVWFVPVFSYRHQNIETWSDGCLTALQAMTDNNGQQLRVSGKSTEGGFEVSHAQGESALDGCVKSFAYWNPAILGATRLLNAQTGEYEEVSVSHEGQEYVTVGEQSVAAERFRLDAQSGEIVLWYTTGDRQWVGLSAPTKSERRLRYLPKRLPGPDMSARLTASAARGAAYESSDGRSAAE
jgi:hypothetical protein